MFQKGEIWMIEHLGEVVSGDRNLDLDPLLDE